VDEDLVDVKGVYALLLQEILTFFFEFLKAFDQPLLHIVTEFLDMEHF
jgi:hypothetical protein